jgi:tRNA/tmRNA/rRNA uracil-C5-methylase (TrmA/RlmC/RlmD family)
MESQKEDNWSSEVDYHLPSTHISLHKHSIAFPLLVRVTDKEQAYQNAASFVPKLATKVMQWLDPQKDDVILDVGCGGQYTP